jgi:hypothetical protein
MHRGLFWINDLRERLQDDNDRDPLVWAISNDLHHILARIDGPNTHPTDRNQRIFYRLVDVGYKMRNQIGAYANFRSGNDDERLVYRLMQQYAARSANLLELNPARDIDAQRQADRRSHLLNVESGHTGAGAHADLDFLRDLRRVVQADWDTLWARPDPFPLGARERIFRQLLDDLIHILDSVCRGEYSRDDHGGVRWQRVRAFDIKDTTIGSLRIRLNKVFHIIEMIKDPDRMVPYADAARRAERVRRLRDFVSPNDRDYVEDIELYIEMFQPRLWLQAGDANGSNNDAVAADIAFRDFLNSFNSLIRNLLDGSDVDFTTDSIQQRIGVVASFDIHNTAVGDIEQELPRLYAFYQLHIAQILSLRIDTNA